ncbi:MAG TPA: DUF4129 domain-containing protein [Acidimicrobiales bacterium]|nr:DUF4129 domain-containing protein [Acidimicrobiales bacterium]
MRPRDARGPAAGHHARGARRRHLRGARGRPLGPTETLGEYAAAALQHSEVADARLEEAAAIVTRAAFGAQAVSDGERAFADGVLEELSSSAGAAQGPERARVGPAP